MHLRDVLLTLGIAGLLVGCAGTPHPPMYGLVTPPPMPPTKATPPIKSPIPILGAMTTPDVPPKPTTKTPPQPTPAAQKPVEPLAKTPMLPPLAPNPLAAPKPDEPEAKPTPKPVEPVALPVTKPLPTPPKPAEPVAKPVPPAPKPTEPVAEVQPAPPPPKPAEPVAKPVPPAPKPDEPVAKTPEPPPLAPAKPQPEDPIATPAPAKPAVPPPPKGAEGMVNLALHAKVMASTTQIKYKGEGPLESVVDGKPDTRWTSEYADKQDLTIDLGAEKPVEILRLFWEAAAAKHYLVQVSADGVDWKQVSELKDQEAKAREDLIRLKDVSARYVRLDLEERATEFGFSLFEVEIWGK